ncbi:MAG: HepT-like ribonuclease domain-containing protein [Thermoguttaceae bacterium]|jgi:uncharacterized protein with HEPN domain
MPDDAATVVDIVLACRRVQRFVAQADEARFAGNEEKHWAVVSQLVLIGEAVRRLSETFRAAHPNIPWSLIAGMRNRLTHEYDKINWALVWRTATVEVGRLLAELEPLAQATRPKSE